jgi:hypothetical protein
MRRGVLMVGLSVTSTAGLFTRLIAPTPDGGVLARWSAAW